MSTTYFAVTVQARARELRVHNGLSFSGTALDGWHIVAETGAEKRLILRTRSGTTCKRVLSLLRLGALKGTVRFIAQW